MRWTRTSTPLGMARAHLQATGARMSQANVDKATRQALDAARALSEEELAELGEVVKRDGATWVTTDVGVLVIETNEVSFWPPDWADNSGSGNLEPAKSSENE